MAQTVDVLYCSGTDDCTIGQDCTERQRNIVQIMGLLVNQGGLHCSGQYAKEIHVPSPENGTYGVWRQNMRTAISTQNMCLCYVSDNVCESASNPIHEGIHHSLRGTMNVKYM